MVDKTDVLKADCLVGHSDDLSALHLVLHSVGMKAAPTAHQMALQRKVVSRDERKVVEMVDLLAARSVELMDTVTAGQLADHLADLSAGHWVGE